MDIGKKKSFKKRDSLIEAALNEFAEKGYESASLNNILKNAGISKGTFYYHFKNKEDLYYYLLKVLSDKKQDFFSKRIAPEIFDTDIFTILKNMIRAGLEFASHNPLINRFSQKFLSEIDSVINRGYIEKASPQLSEFFTSMLEKAYKRGDIRRDLPKDFTINLMSLLFAHIFDIVQVNNINDIEKAADNLVKVLKNGLSGRQTERT